MRSKIESEGTKLAFVYMDTPERAEAFFSKYGLQDTLRFRDAPQSLYKAFELRRAEAWAILNPATLWRFLQAIGRGHGVGIPTTDKMQMPGAFLFHQGKIVKSFRHKTVSDRPDYCELAQA